MADIFFNWFIYLILLIIFVFVVDMANLAFEALKTWIQKEFLGQQAPSETKDGTLDSTK